MCTALVAATLHARSDSGEPCEGTAPRTYSWWIHVGVPSIWSFACLACFATGDCLRNLEQVERRSRCQIPPEKNLKAFEELTERDRERPCLHICVLDLSIYLLVSNLSTFAIFKADCLQPFVNVVSSVWMSQIYIIMSNLHENTYKFSLYVSLYVYSCLFTWFLVYF